MSAISRRARVSRLLAWSLLAAVPTLRFGLARADVPWQVALVVGDVLVYFAPMALCAALGVVIASTVARHAQRERAFWLGMSLSAVLVLVSETYWTWYAVTVNPGGPPFGAWTHWLHGAAALTMFLALAGMTRIAVLPLSQRLCFYLDVTAFAVLAWPVVVIAWTSRLFAAYAPDADFAAALAAVYPLVGSVMIVFTSLVLTSWVARQRPTWEGLTAASIFTYGASLLFAPLMQANIGVSPPSVAIVATLVFGSGFALLVVGGVYRLTTDVDEVAPEPWPLPRVLAPRAMRGYPVLASIGLAIMAWGAFEVRHTPVAGILLVAVVLLACVLALRSWIAAMERAALRVRASTDPETGLGNRTALERQAEILVETAADAGIESSVVVFDTWPLTPERGSQAGAADEICRAFARLVQQEADGTHSAYRVSGDRFAVLIAGAGPAAAAEFALRVWVAAGKDPVLAPSSGVAGVFAGVASYPRHALRGQQVLAAAEVAVSAAHGFEGEPVVVYDRATVGPPLEERHRRERLRAQRATVRGLAGAVDARDPATRHHSTNVAELATALARALDLPDGEVQLIGLGALMHDVGKIGVADEILLKPGLLDEAERAAIEQHPVLGEQILAPARLDDILPLVRSHHERWDGSGYPDGLAGEDIPLEARILAVCDAYETITTGRPYGSALTTGDALAEIEACAGKQFDPAVAGVFVRMIRGLGATRETDSSTGAGG